MEKAVKTQGSSQSKKQAAQARPPKASFIGSMIEDFFLKPPLSKTITYLNLVFAYFVTLVLLSGHHITYWLFLLYLPLIYFLNNWRNSRKEAIRVQIAHRMPFFADTLANSLSVGANLHEAFIQASYYLKGEIKYEFDKLIAKSILGKDMGKLLRDIDNRFPKTGLRYLISLIEEYKVLGVGISPMLKKMADALTLKEESEEKIRTILAAGSSYARLSIGVFVCLFVAISFMLKDQIHLLMAPHLKPIFIFLLVWTCVGILVVTRITSMDFAKNYALRPQIAHFMQKKEFTMEDLFAYTGGNWSPGIGRVLLYGPLGIGFLLAYAGSWYHSSVWVIIGLLVGGVLISKMIIEYILKGVVEDQLIQTIETFPELLQVFIIGLNSGLNYYLAFQFAHEAIKGSAPRLLTKELTRTQFAMECGEPQTLTWEKLGQKLPFETVIDFSEIMVVAPMQGESIVKSIAQMTNGYQTKKLTLVEKKAVKLGQMVIPVIVMAFFPLFLFVVFAPLLSKMSVLFQH